MKNKIEVEEIINKVAKETAKQVINELKENKYIKIKFSYYRRAELLLINYNKLKAAIKQKDEDIEYIEMNGLPQRSGSIVAYQSSNGNVSLQEKYIQLIEKYKLEKIETEREIKRIDNALEKIKQDKYYKIIELKYLNTEEKVPDEKIAEILDKDQSTITRNRKRLINNIKIILFPESIKEFS